MKRLILLPILVVGCTAHEHTEIRPQAVTGTARNRVLELYTALVACREHRRDEMCTPEAKTYCAIVMGARPEDKPIPERDRARCSTNCLTGYMYVAALDNILGQMKLGDLRPEQIKIATEQLEECTSGRDLAATGRKFKPLP